MNYDLKDNLDKVFGALVTFSLSGEPPVDADDWNAAVASAKLGEAYVDDGNDNAVNFKNRFSSISDTYAVNETLPNGKIGYTGRHKVSTLPLKRDGNVYSATFVIGTHSGDKARSTPVATVKFNVDTGEWMISTETDADLVLDMPIGECAEAVMRCIASHRKVDQARIAGHIVEGMKYVDEYHRCLSYRNYYDKVLQLRGSVPNVTLSRGTFFVANDVDAGDKNPVLEVLKLKEAFGICAKQNSLYTVPLFPSPDTIGMVRVSAEETLTDRVAKVHVRLEKIETWNKGTFGAVLEELETTRAEANLYRRLLSMEVAGLDDSIAKAEAAVNAAINGRLAKHAKTFA